MFILYQSLLHMLQEVTKLYGFFLQGVSYIYPFPVVKFQLGSWLLC